MPQIQINQVGLYYETVGAGEAVLFLHGFTGSGQDWANQMKAIQNKYQGIALDLRGHGKSAAPAEEKDYSIYLNCDDVYQLLNHLGIDRCCLVGHSMGGRYMTEFMRILRTTLGNPNATYALLNPVVSKEHLTLFEGLGFGV